MKTTYIYRVELGHAGVFEVKEYCYARNKKVAEAYYKEKYRDRKFDSFRAIAFGDVDFARHPGPIEELPQDEVNYILSHNLGMAEAYSNRVDRIPAANTFVPKET